MVTDFPTCRFARFQTVEIIGSRACKDANEVTPELLSRFAAQVTEPGVETGLLVQKYGNAHSFCIMIKVEVTKILLYDPLSQEPCVRAAKPINTASPKASLSHGRSIYSSVVSLLTRCSCSRLL